MANNVKFLRGLESSLPEVGVPGYFYLTTDTHRLHVGTEDQKIVRLNRDLVWIDKFEDLPEVTDSNRFEVAGRLYFAADTNILAFYDTELNDWAQVNPDTGATAVSFATDAEGNVIPGDVITGVEYNAATRTLVFTKGYITANKVKTTQEITVTTDVGNYSKNDKISSNSDIESILLNMLCQDSDPSATQPSVSITLKNNSSKYTSDTYLEAGTIITPKYDVSNNIGSYSANGVSQPSGVGIASTTVTEKGRPGAQSEATASATSGGFESFKAADGMTYYFSVSTSFTAAPDTHVNNKGHKYPVTFLGNTNANCDSVRIASQTKTNSSVKVYTYRPVFYGYKTADNVIDMDKINSVDIRTLTAARNMKTDGFNTTNMKQLILAFPASQGIKSVAVQGSPAPKNMKKLDRTIDVLGLNDYTAVPYTVFYSNQDIANTGDEKIQSITPSTSEA